MFVLVHHNVKLMRYGPGHNEPVNKGTSTQHSTLEDKTLNSKH